MFSIIICSRKKEISHKLYQNISETIGVPFEVLCIDNSRNDYSMCSAYNEGVKRAKYPFLCFMHEDVTFLSKEWGKECVKEFEKIDVWMLGDLGTKYMDAMFYNCTSLKTLPDISIWNTSNIINMHCFYFKCSSLLKIPDISIWNTDKIIDIFLFFHSVIL